MRSRPSVTTTEVLVPPTSTPATSGPSSLRSRLAVIAPTPVPAPVPSAAPTLPARPRRRGRGRTRSACRVRAVPVRSIARIAGPRPPVLAERRHRPDQQDVADVEHADQPADGRSELACGVKHDLPDADDAGLKATTRPVSSPIVGSTVLAASTSARMLVRVSRQPSDHIGTLLPRDSAKHGRTRRRHVRRPGTADR